jgi:hypothetical protein
MVKRTAHTTGTAASGVNACFICCSERGATNEIEMAIATSGLVLWHLCILDNSVMEIERDRREPPWWSCLETLENSEITLKQCRKVGFEDAKSWMECRLACMRSGIPNSKAKEMAFNWAQQLNLFLGDLDKPMAEIEATNLAQHYTRTHVPHLGNMEKLCPEGGFGLLGGQMNSALFTDTCLWKTGNIVWLCKEFEIQGGLLSEVGVNWSTFPHQQI